MQIGCIRGADWLYKRDVQIGCIREEVQIGHTRENVHTGHARGKKCNVVVNEKWNGCSCLVD